MSPDEEEVRRELLALRRGWALHSPDLRTRIGPRTATACGIRETDSERVTREKIITTVQRLTGDLPEDLRLAAAAALAVDSRAAHRHLADRIDWLAAEMHWAPRTARRRVDDAFGRLAEAILRTSRDRCRRADPDTGWYVRKLSALLRLDDVAPELYEDRTIVAERDGLAAIRVRFSLPRHRDGAATRQDLQATVLRGARLDTVEREGEVHFRYSLVLPQPLRYGESLDYTMVFRIPPGQPMRTHYAFLPLVPCAEFHLRVRFDPRRRPVAVWRLDKLPPRLLDEPPVGRERLPLDPAAEVNLAFPDLVQGFGYGVAWTPSDAS